MATKRVKMNAGPIIKTREEMEEVVRTINELTQIRDSLTVEMDAELTEVREQYAGKMFSAQTNLDKIMGFAKEWAEANKESFGDRKSIEMAHGVVGFRTGTPKLKPLAGMTWEKIKARLLNFGKGYTRTTVEVDKEAILADREALKAEGLQALGVKVAQDESFYVEPKRESIESARVVA